MRRVAVRTVVGGDVLGDHASERAVKEAVGRSAAVLRRLEPHPHLARTERDLLAVAEQFPAIGGVRRRDGHRRGDLFVGGAEEREDQLPGVGRRLHGAADATAVDQHQVARVELRRRVSGRNEVDRLLGEAHLVAAAGEVVGAVESVRRAALGARGEVGGPAGQAQVEAGVGKQVGVRVGLGQIDPRVADVERGAREPLPGGEAGDAEVVERLVYEPRLAPLRVDDGGALRMEVVAVDVFLPVEDVVERDDPVDQRAARSGVQRVVVAEEAGLAVVVDSHVGAGLGPEDVVADLHFGGAGRHEQVRAGFVVERVLHDPHVVDTRGPNAPTRVAIDQVVVDELLAVGLNARGVPRDAVEEHRAVEIDAGRVAVDQVGVLQVVGPEGAGAGHAGGVGHHVLVLHPAGQLDTDVVAVDQVWNRGPDVSQRVGLQDHVGLHAGVIAVDLVIDQFRRGEVAHADRSVADAVLTDRAVKGDVYGQTDGVAENVVVDDLSARYPVDADRRGDALEAVALDVDVDRPAERHFHAAEPAVERVMHDLGPLRTAAQRDVAAD